ncbi:MAG: phosphoribosylaminoimidazolesuccinocarboxamide synthase [bacterium]
MKNTEFKRLGKKPIARGKTKRIWAVDGHDDVVIMYNTNETTADNDPNKTRSMAKKARCATTTTSRMFELLEEAGIPTAYVKQLSSREILAKKCAMIPLEVIIRRYAVGSYLDRMPQLKREGNPLRFHQLKYELFLKTSKGRLDELDLRNHLPSDKKELLRYLNIAKTLKDINEGRKEAKAEPITDLLELSQEELVEEVIKIIDDPWIEDPTISSLKWVLRHPKKPTWEIAPLTIFVDGCNIISLEKLKEIEELTRKTFLVLEGAWNTLGYRLIDFKIEFGIDTKGNLVIADVIDNDSWRLRTADWKELSKQNFRDGHPLANVQENYVRVAELTNQLRIPKQAIVFWRGSDKDPLERFADNKFPGEILPGIIHENILASGHKSPGKVIEALEDLHAKYPEGAVIIAIVGMSNGLGPILSARTSWPVLSYCNSAKTNPEDVWSNLRMPSGVPNTTFLSLDNAYLAALNILSAKNPAAYKLRQYAIETLEG